MFSCQGYQAPVTQVRSPQHLNSINIAIYLKKLSKEETTEVQTYGLRKGRGSHIVITDRMTSQSAHKFNSYDV